MPIAPLVEPPDCRLSSDARISPFRDAGVEGSANPELPAYVTIATRSSARSRSTSNRNDSFTSGSLLAEFIEPDTSIKNTRFAGLRSVMETSRPLSPMRTKRCSGAHGADDTSSFAANGTSPFGGA